MTRSLGEEPASAVEPLPGSEQRTALLRLVLILGSAVVVSAGVLASAHIEVLRRVDLERDQISRRAALSEMVAAADEGLNHEQLRRLVRAVDNEVLHVVAFPDGVPPSDLPPAVKLALTRASLQGDHGLERVDDAIAETVHLTVEGTDWVVGAVSDREFVRRERTEVVRSLVVSLLLAFCAVGAVGLTALTWTVILPFQRMTETLARRAQGDHEARLELPVSHPMARVAVTLNDILARESLWHREMSGFFTLTQDLLCVMSATGELRRTNPAFTDLLGYEADRLLGRRLDELVHPDDRPRFVHRFSCIVVGERVAPFEARMRHQRGDWVLARWSLVGSGLGRIYGAATDVTSSRVLEREARRTRRILERAQRIGDMGSWWRDSSGRLECSEQMCRMFGWEQAPADLRALGEAFDYRDRDRFERALERLESGGVPLSIQARVVEPGGARRTIQITAERIEDGDDEVLAGVALDVTERVARQRALSRADSELREARMVRDRFLDNLGHELRTPLHGLIGQLWLLDGEERPEERAQLLERSRRCADALVTLVDDVIELTRADSGGSSQDRSFDLTGVAQDVLELLDLPARNRRNQLLLDIAPDLPVLVRGDPARVRRVLLHLVDNAVRYTRDGEVRVAIRRGHGDGLVLEVSDTGEGFDPAVVPAEGAVPLDAKGGRLGLGLATCRRSVAAMGGRLEIESAVGEGSCLRVHLALPEDHGGRGLRTARGRAGGLDGTVLVATEDPVTPLVARRMLERLGCRVCEAQTAEAVAETLERCRIDLILVDSAIGADDLTRAAVRAGRVPVIQLVGEDEPVEDSETTRVSWPARLPSLQRVLGRWLPQRRSAPPAGCEEIA